MTICIDSFFLKKNKAFYNESLYYNKTVLNLSSYHRNNKCNEILVSQKRQCYF